MQERRVRKLRQEMFTYLAPVIFLTVFSSIWVAISIVTREIPMILSSLIPVGLFVGLLAVFLRGVKTYRSAKIALKKGTEENARVVAKSKFGLSTNNGPTLYGVKLEISYEGQTFYRWTPRSYSELEAEAILEKGELGILRYGKHILVVEELELNDDYIEYEPRSSSRPVGNSAYAQSRASRIRKPASSLSGAQKMKNLASAGNKDAIEMLSITDVYQKMRYCALFNVDEEVEACLRQCVSELPVGEKVRRQMQWYRNVSGEITELPLSEGIRLVEFFMHHLESEEVRELIGEVVAKGEDEFVLPSAISRRIKEFKRALEVADRLREGLGKEEIIRLVEENEGSIGSAVVYVVNVALENTQPESYQEVSRAIINYKSKPILLNNYKDGR